MSVNYHAAQSRGLLLDHSDAGAEQWYQKFRGYDPSRIAALLGLSFDDKYLYVDYYQRRYRLSLAFGTLEKEEQEKCQEEGKKETEEEKETKEGWSRKIYFNEAMAIYHLLLYVREDARVSGTWVASDSVDGVVSRGRMPDPLLAPFAAEYSGRMEDLKEACLRCGGRPLDKGDVGFEFEAFPSVHLQLVFYDADEDFPAQASILVDEHITDYLHYETIGCLICDLLDQIRTKEQGQCIHRQGCP